MNPVTSCIVIKVERKARHDKETPSEKPKSFVDAVCGPCVYIIMCANRPIGYSSATSKEDMMSALGIGDLLPILLSQRL